MRPLLKLVVVGVMLVILGGAIAWPHRASVPIRLGTAKGYWAAAVGVREKNILGGPSWCLAHPIDGWFLYTADHMHGSYFYRVAESEVLADFPKSVEQLGGDGKVVLEWAGAGFRTWEKADPQRADARLLLRHLRAARLDWWIRKYQEDLAFQTERDFHLGVAWQRMGLFPLVQLAEWAYLSALIVFAAWPWLRNRGRWTWTIHVALLPPLLLLPYYLGYCEWNYTSAGPGGGVVYPFLLDAFRWLPRTAVDTVMIRHVPQVLAPLTGPLGPMMPVSGGRSVGPLAAVCLGLGLGILVAGPGTLRGWLRWLADH
jgi:hypothetical protein